MLISLHLAVDCHLMNGLCWHKGSGESADWICWGVRSCHTATARDFYFLRSREQLPNPLSNFIISQRCRCRRRIVRPSSMGHKAIDLGGSFRGDCRDCIISKPGQPVFQPASKKSMEINHRKACGRLESLFFCPPPRQMPRQLTALVQ